MHNRKAFAAALVVGIFLPVAGAAAVPKVADSGTIGIKLLEAPATKRADPRAKLYIIDALPAGTTIKRRVGVTNRTTKSVRISLYAAAAQIKGGSFVSERGHTQNELSSWISVSPAAVDVAAGREATAVVTIAVPKGATNGEQYAAVWAEPPAAAGRNGVAEVNRVGVRVYLAVGAGEPASNFTIDSMTASRAPDGKPVVTAQVHNTGGRALDMSGSLRLTKGPGGLSAGPFPAKLGTTLGIGQTEPVSVFLDKALPNGPWVARLDLESGLIKRSATATITFPDAGAAAPVKAKLVEDDKSAPWPLIAAGVGGLLALGIVFFFFFKRRSRPEDERDQHIPVTHRG